MEDATPDPAVLLKLAKTRMPFGRYKGRLLIDLPKPYVIWYAKKGFPEGEPGRMEKGHEEVCTRGDIRHEKGDHHAMTPFSYISTCSMSRAKSRDSWPMADNLPNA